MAVPKLSNKLASMHDHMDGATNGFMVREYDADKDVTGADAVDRSCEVGPKSKLCLFTDLLGDPLSRVRHSPAFLMLVAETISPEKKIVGVIRGCVKTVSRGNKNFTCVGYILGLRVSPSHRRMGIGVKLVQRMEEWFKLMKAEYSYMATDKENEASLKLFIGRCGYSKFRTPSILVHPVFSGHRLSVSRRRNVSIISLSPSDAAILYCRYFSSVEFFPVDIDKVLSNSLSLGTFIAVEEYHYGFTNVNEFLANTPESWAVLSVWNSKKVFTMEVRGASAAIKSAAWVSRAADKAAPWLRIPSVPNLFKPFGMYLLYGIGGSGPCAAALLKCLCRYVHNMARDGGCAVVAAEVAACEPLRGAVPHWRRLSCSEDLWCAKRLAAGQDSGDNDWTKAPPGSSIFVDPREF